MATIESLRDDRSGITIEKLFELLVYDLKLLRKILCIVQYYSSINVADVEFNRLLHDSIQELKQQIIYFNSSMVVAGIDPKQNINETFNEFGPSVEGRVCLFASNGIFMDTFAGFQTRDIPLNNIKEFVSIKESYFLLEHIHEALKMNCELRLKQIDRLNIKYHKKNENIDHQLKIIKRSVLDIGKYAYDKHHLYELMVNRH